MSGLLATLAIKACQNLLFLGRLRVIVERVYGEIKKFEVFERPWRGSIPNHHLLWLIALNVANIKHRYYPIDADLE
jgi:hypothetical protein